MKFTMQEPDEILLEKTTIVCSIYVPKPYIHSLHKMKMTLKQSKHKPYSIINHFLGSGGEFLNNHHWYSNVTNKFYVILKDVNFNSEYNVRLVFNSDISFSCLALD